MLNCDLVTDTRKYDLINPRDLENKSYVKTYTGYL